MTAALAVREKERLETCEQIIERGLQTFVTVGMALAEIRDSRLYRETHGTFEEYCRERWNLARDRAYQLIEAAGVVENFPHDQPPAIESHARELARVPEDERADVWREANERTEGKPTAAAIRDVREERQPEWPNRPAAGLNPSPALADPKPKRDIGDVLEERMPGTRADMQRTALRARWSKDMAAVADIDLLDMAEVRALIDNSEANLAIGTLRGVADRLEKAGRPGLRIVGGNSE